MIVSGSCSALGLKYCNEGLQISDDEQSTSLYEQSTSLYEQSTSLYEQSTSLYEQSTSLYEQSTSLYEQSTSLSYTDALELITKLGTAAILTIVTIPQNVLLDKTHAHRKLPLNESVLQLILLLTN